LREAEDQVVVLDADVLAGYGAARALLLRLIVPREVAADGRPAHASVGRPEDHVACVVDDARVVTRDEDGLRPVEAVLQVRRLVAVRVVRPHADVLRLPGLRIVAGQDPDVLAGVDAAAVGCRRDVAGLAAAYGLPVGAGDRALFAPAANGDRGVVLLRAVDHV